MNSKHTSAQPAYITRGRRSQSTQHQPTPQPQSPQPSPPSPLQPPIERPAADRYSLWFNSYLSTIITVAILGGQITFTLVVGQLADPVPSSIFTPNTVRHLIAAAWLLFTATLGVGVLMSLLFTDVADHYGTGDIPRFDGVFGLWVSFLLNFLPIGAFLLLGLATVAYAPVVGWIGVAGVGGFGVLVGKYWWHGW